MSDFEKDQSIEQIPATAGERLRLANINKYNFGIVSCRYLTMPYRKRRKPDDRPR